VRPPKQTAPPFTPARRPPNNDDDKRIQQQNSITLAWILVSAGVVLLNKHVLEAVFPLPLALTTLHQGVCAAAAAAFAPALSPLLGPRAWRRQVLPVGLLFALSLAAGNAAYLRLEVHFIQMLKALSPLVVYGAGVAAGVEPARHATLAAAAVVAAGVAVASATEARFDGAGVALQIGSILCESARLVLVQRLLLPPPAPPPSCGGGGSGGGGPPTASAPRKISPVQMMALVSPACLLFLVPATAALEGRRLAALVSAARVPLAASGSPPPLLLPLAASALSALALNVTIFALVGRAGALSLNVAGVAKDALLVAASALVFGAAVRRAQVAGYALALCGALHYGWRRAADKEEAAMAAAAAEEEARAGSKRGGGGAGKEDGEARGAGAAAATAPRPPGVRAVAAAERAALLVRRSTGGGGKSDGGGGGG